MFIYVYAFTCLSILVAEFHGVFTFGRTICAPKLEDYVPALLPMFDYNMHSCVYMYTHIYICISLYIYIYMCVCMYMYMYMYM